MVECTPGGAAALEPESDAARELELVRVLVADVARARASDGERARQLVIEELQLPALGEEVTRGQAPRERVLGVDAVVDVAVQRADVVAADAVAERVAGVAADLEAVVLGP